MFSVIFSIRKKRKRKTSKKIDIFKLNFHLRYLKNMQKKNRLKKYFGITKNRKSKYI